MNPTHPSDHVRDAHSDHDHNRHHDHDHHDGHDHDHEHDHGHDHERLFVDNERYCWDGDTITGAQLRELASLPEDVQIFHKVHGHPDVEVDDATVVDLTKQRGPDRFCTQPVGSQAG